VISSSPTDVQPVFETIVASARTLTGAQACGVFLLQGDIVSIAAHDSWRDESRREYPRAVNTNTVTGRAMLERRTVHARDLRVQA
jgi:two-component system NtrC family sensor kinase